MHKKNTIYFDAPLNFVVATLRIHEILKYKELAREIFMDQKLMIL